jgi:hypothetical protein
VNGTLIVSFGPEHGFFASPPGEARTDSRNLESPANPPARRKPLARVTPAHPVHLESAAARVYRRLTGLQPNPSQCQLLAAQAIDVQQWEATLEHWLLHGWNLRNIAGQLEMYRRGGSRACRYCQRGKRPLDQTLESLGRLRKELTDGEH